LSARPNGEERVVLVHIHFSTGQMAEDLQEFKELALSAGAVIAAIITGTRSVPDAKYFVGSGKAEEIHQTVTAMNATLVIFNHVLSPAQERNLERLLQCRVLDRTGLILDIFAQRARSFEGNLQVELALLKHMSTRLIRGWTHLERQRGGIGLRGPGETQLEVDRRLLKKRIKTITERLKKLRAQRELSRHARRKAIIPTVALVGYTNAGKSTLFNCLTGEKSYVANQLFATLDPTLRKAYFPETGDIILADTVGFIRHLPHTLIEAFHATLEEVVQADLLLHVIDANDPQRDAHIAQVNEVLASIKADNVPIILVYNKIDLNPSLAPRFDRDAAGLCKQVYISAEKSLGIAELVLGISERLFKGLVEKTISLPADASRCRAELYQRDVVLKEQINDEGEFILTVRMPREEYEKLVKSVPDLKQTKNKN
jgi:GTPase